MYYRASVIHHVLRRERRSASPVLSLSGKEAERLMTMNEAHQPERAGTPPKPRRSGSERRQKGRIVPFRVSETEYAELDALAEREGLSIGTYVRERVLKAPTTRPIRRPVVESSFHLAPWPAPPSEQHNQTARRVSMGDTLSRQCTLAACRQILDKS